MKTIFFILTLCFPIVLMSQSSAGGAKISYSVEYAWSLENGDPDTLLEYVDNVLSKQKVDGKSKAELLYLKGKALYLLGEKSLAGIPLQTSLSFAEKTNYNGLAVKTLIVLSATTGDIDKPDLDLSLKYLTKALEIALKEPEIDTLSLSKIYINLSNVYYDLEKYDTAVINNNLCESLLSKAPDTVIKAKNLYGKTRALIELYITNGKKQDLVVAQESIQKAIDIFRKLEKKEEEAHALNLASGVSLRLEDFRRAETEIKMSIDIGQRLQDTTMLINGYYNLANQYRTEDKKAEARAALNTLADLLDAGGSSQDNEFVEDQFAGRGRVAATLVKDEVLLIDKQLDEEKHKRQMQMMAFISFLLVAGVAAGWYILTQRAKLVAKKAEIAEQDAILAAQKQQLAEEEVQSLLASQEVAYMRARSEGAEEGRHRIARQIHDDVGGLLVSAKWNLQTALEELPSKESKVISRLNENLRLQEISYKELRRVVYALEREDVPWWEDLQQFYQRLSEQSGTKIQFYNYNLDMRLRGAFGEECRSIVRELITNAIKYAKATEITVHINLIDEVLGIMVEDDGKGFTPGKKVDGTGLRGIQERAAKLGGTVIFESSEGAGTTVFVDIPITNQSTLKENPLLYAGTN